MLMRVALSALILSASSYAVAAQAPVAPRVALRLGQRPQPHGP